jgi:hypothetical protein
VAPTTVAVLPAPSTSAIDARARTGTPRRRARATRLADLAPDGDADAGGPAWQQLAPGGRQAVEVAADPGR